MARSTKKDRNQQRDGECRQQKVFQQLIRFGLGRLAVVARSCYGHIVGQSYALHLMDALHHRIRNVCCVGALALGHGNRYSGILPRCLMRSRAGVGCSKDNIIGWIGRAVHNLVCDIAQIDGTTVIHGHHNTFKVFTLGK